MGVQEVMYVTSVFILGARREYSQRFYNHSSVFPSYLSSLFFPLI